MNPSTETASDVTRIVVGIDFSEPGDSALRRALEIASDTPGSEPHVVHVAAAFGPMLRLELLDDVRSVSLQEASTYLQSYVEERMVDDRGHLSAALSRVVTHVRVGSPADEIAQLAVDLEAQLVVVGTHGRKGVQRLLVGSVAEGVVRLAPSPVLVVRSTEYRLPKGLGRATPPCPRCAEVRRESDGRRLWCEEHARPEGSAAVPGGEVDRETGERSD